MSPPALFYVGIALEIMMYRCIFPCVFVPGILGASWILTSNKWEFQKRINKRKEITNELIQEMVPALKDMILQIERAHPVPTQLMEKYPHREYHGEMLALLKQEYL